MSDEPYQPLEDRRLFEIYSARAQKHPYIPLFITFGIPLVIGFFFTMSALSLSGNARGAMMAVGVLFYGGSLGLLIPALVTKGRHDSAKRFVLEWYKRHPEDKPVATQVNVNIQTGWAGELRDLKELLDEGIITQEEYEYKKRKLLGIQEMHQYNQEPVSRPDYSRFIDADDVADGEEELSGNVDQAMVDAESEAEEGIEPVSLETIQMQLDEKSRG